MFAWLTKIFKKTTSNASNSKTAQNNIPQAQTKNIETQVGEPLGMKANEDGPAYLERVREKINSLAERYANGSINNRQFHVLYAHYQDEISTIEQYLTLNPESDEWKNAVKEGQSVLIRRKNTAQLLGFSIYDNLSSMPLKTLGQFGVDSDLFVPMLASYQSASHEIFGGGMRSTQIEGGRWLCFTPGELTTTLALFSTEPSGKQMKTLEQLHTLFEKANKIKLETPPIDVDALVCPHEFFISHPL
jgi:hypothetical protein